MTTNETATQTDTEPTVRKDYSSEDRQRIVRECSAMIAGGATIKEAASAHGIDRVTLWRWKEEDDELRNLYARARDQSADADEDEAVEVARQSLHAASSEEVQAARLLVDTLKWRAAKRRPKEYGDKQQVETTVTHRMLPPEERDAQLARIVARANVLPALHLGDAEPVDQEPHPPPSPD